MFLTDRMIALYLPDCVYILDILGAEHPIMIFTS